MALDDCHTTIMTLLQTLRNNSVLKMAAARQPDVPTRLYKPLPNFQLLWMKKKLAKVGILASTSAVSTQISGA